MMLNPHDLWKPLRKTHGNFQDTPQVQPIPDAPPCRRASSSAGELRSFGIGQAFADVLLKGLDRLADEQRLPPLFGS